MFLGVGGGVWQCVGVGGGTTSATVNAVVHPQGGGCSNIGSNGGSNVFAMATTRADIGQRDDIGWGEEEDMVPMAAAMLSREGVVHNTTRGGGGGRRM